MRQNTILGVIPNYLSKDDILEKIKKYISKPDGVAHIVSLNPEIFVLLHNDSEFKRVIRAAKVSINDGIGTVIAGRILGLSPMPRLTGVDLMENLMQVAIKGRLKALFIGGRGNLAERLVKCYEAKYPEADFKGIQGIESIKKPKKTEEKKLFSIVTDYKPRLIFVSFGSPYQELWLWRNRHKLKGIVCMGVGGAFELLEGSVSRAPSFLRSVGLEWFFRLLVQPWRWRRQLRLFEFGWLVLKQRLGVIRFEKF